jgi:hypothetical protein
MKTFCWGEKIPRNLFSQNPFDNGTYCFFPGFNLHNFTPSIGAL